MATVFRRATFDEELITMERWRHLWGDGLSSNRLKERESVLRSHVWGKRVEVYVIVDQDTNEVYSSCDVYNVPAVLGGAAVELLHIASLFTPEIYRGKGYASSLIRSVINLGEKRHGVVGIILFSDIGSAFYNSLGFHVAGDDEVPYDFVFPVSEVSLDSSAPFRVEMIRKLETLMESDFNNDETNTLADENTAVLPFELLRADFHIFFDSFSPGAPSDSSIYVAARVNPSESSQNCGGSIIFTADYSTKELEILSFVANGDDVAAYLLVAAKKEAASRGLTSVRLWCSGSKQFSPTSKCIVDLKGKCLPRKGRLPMLYSLSKELQILAPLSRVHWW
jgi:GNAT superfamily N-acetyltransferase